MKQMRYSLAHCFVVFALVALDLAAIMDPTGLSASIFFTLYLGALGLSIVTACLGRGGVRKFAFGFAVFGLLHIFSASFGYFDIGYWLAYRDSFVSGTAQTQSQQATALTISVLFATTGGVVTHYCFPDLERP